MTAEIAVAYCWAVLGTLLAAAAITGLIVIVVDEIEKRTGGNDRDDRADY